MKSNRDILLVEDNPSDIDLTKRALAKGHVANDLIVADDGQKALDYLFGKGEFAGRDTSTVPALVLLDLKLPKVSGFEVLRQIRADVSIKHLPVVILTTSAEQRDVVAGYNLFVNSYIRKPVDFNQFVECVKQLGLYWLVLNEPPYPREEVL
ncbi:MAG: response regulator [Terracidiphilus sp.]